MQKRTFTNFNEFFLNAKIHEFLRTFKTIGHGFSVYADCVSEESNEIGRVRPRNQIHQNNFGGVNRRFQAKRGAA